MMPKKMLIVFASLKEAKPFLFNSKIKFAKSSSDEFRASYKGSDITVIIAGIGIASKRFLKGFSKKDFAVIIKAGTCAVTDPGLELLVPYIPKYIRYFLSKKKLFGNGVYFQLKAKFRRAVKEICLASVKRPLNDTVYSSSLFKKGIRLADMETLYVHLEFKKTPLIPVLIGTDRGGKGSKKDFFNNIEKASALLKEILPGIIETVKSSFF